MDRKEIKSKAKEQIKGNILTFLGVMVVACIIFCVSGFVVIGPIILGGAISLGITKFVLEVIREKKGKFATMFSGFNKFGSSLIAFILQTLFISLWSILLIVPGIIAAFRYSMTFYILADNPEMSGLDAIKKSKAMMIGHKGELFVLMLSFLGWYILCGITFGIAAIYVVPYVDATVANFYEEIKSEQAA